MENGVVVPLPDFEKTPRGTLASKADLLWGYVDGNFNILHDFLSKFSPLEISTASEDFSARCPPEVLES